MKLKKTITIAAAFAALAVTAPIASAIPNPFSITASAEEYEPGDNFMVCASHLILNDFATNGDDCAYFFSCKVLDDGTLSIGTASPVVGVEFGHVTVPSEIMGYTVTEITSFQPTNTTITIPSTVTSIADNAFENNPVSAIIGEAGSYAETYANQKGITFNSTSSDTPEDTSPDTTESKTDTPSNTDTSNNSELDSAADGKTSNGNSADNSKSDTSSKPNNPDTGTAAVATVMGVAALAGATALIARKKRN